MRQLKYILASYIFLLSLIPCGDEGGGVLIFVMDQITGSTLHDDFSGTNDCEHDWCSPFCICSCCSTTLDIPEDIDFAFELPGDFSGDKPMTSSSYFARILTSSIWQPPRFC